MEEKKTYSVVGTVTIGTDEYRDLLSEKFEAIKDKDYWYQRYWDTDKAKDLMAKELEAMKERVEVLSKQLEQFKRFIKENDEQDKMELWILKLSREDN